MATGSSLSRDTGSAPTGAWSAGPRWLLRCPQDRLIGLREKPLATSSSRSTLKPNGARLMACADLGVNADFDFQDHVRLASNRSHLQNAIEVFDGPAANCCRRRVIALHFDSQLLLRTVLTLLNVELRLVPTVVIAPMITTDMSAAINPYSIAVAPVSSSRNAATMPFASPRRRRIAKFI